MKVSKLAWLFVCSSILLGIEGGSSTTTTTTGTTCVSSSSSPNACVEDSSDNNIVPFVAARTLSSNGKNVILHDEEEQDNLKDVYGCCSFTTNNNNNEEMKTELIGKMYQMTTEESLDVLKMANEVGWQGGAGKWPQMSLEERMSCLTTFLDKLQSVRTPIIQILMWEIGKNEKDATAEFDRTMAFVKQIMTVIRTNDEFGTSSFQTIGNSNVRAMVKRAAIGIVLCLGPYNYPLNETYAAMIPALLTGNIVVLKLPTTGGLAHLLTMQAIVDSFPPHTVNFISGGGRATMPPLMKTGLIDALAFIGSSRAADNLIQVHPHPHRLKLFLQLEAKNMGIFLPDIFTNPQMLQKSLDEAVTGSLSFNGQRCTALKLLFVPRQLNNDVDNNLVPNDSPGFYLAKEISNRVEQLTVGLPWQKHNTKQSQITPLPDQGRVKYMKQLIQDALDKGASILNEGGGQIIGGTGSSTLMIPAVLYPVTKDMDIYHEEQFGPIVPIAEYDDLNVVIEYATKGKYGQQVSIFTAAAASSTSDNNSDAANLIDIFSNIFGKININSQCGRSPDTLPFSGRRSSALGVMSVTEVLKEFSVPTVISYKEETSSQQQHQQMVEQIIQPSSSFMSSLS